jgi:hypothetical protein
LGAHKVHDVGRAWCGGSLRPVDGLTSSDAARVLLGGVANAEIGVVISGEGIEVGAVPEHWSRLFFGPEIAVTFKCKDV